jgi:hypothetical protein
MAINAKIYKDITRTSINSQTSSSKAGIIIANMDGQPARRRRELALSGSIATTSDPIVEIEDFVLYGSNAQTTLLTPEQTYFFDTSPFDSYFASWEVNSISSTSWVGWKTGTISFALTYTPTAYNTFTNA